MLIPSEKQLQQTAKVYKEASSKELEDLQQRLEDKRKGRHEINDIVLKCWNAVLERERLQEEATQRLSQPAISRRTQKVVTDQHIVL